MKITILTLFPKVFENFLGESVIKKIITKNKIKIQTVDFRKFSKEKNHKVDDYQYGGGAGMVLQLQPLVDAIKKYRTKNSKVILMSPQGQTFNQEKARSLSKATDLILICGHYEGFDERILNYVDEQISIGDYILTGGELAAMVIVDAVIRLTSDGISKESLECETFDNNLLDYPTYTKPVIYDGFEVPKVLLSGDHKKIENYRKEQQIIKTKKLRPDLYNIYTSSITKDNGKNK
ncbi:MAG: tRNA (guanosine(37)-N1)-methyltransferase TrmD [Mycoplasmataceae bacterium]|jgi:tRNA (guanine37-N1)-methyltransferase|nr:tRNA (guanosine(37)-N1)-methyltransferase TrmD [Mycoplasmataceae bacterium]